MLHVTVKITGDKTEIAKLKKLGDKLSNFSSAMRRIGDELKGYYSGQVFASQGGALGHRWTNLSPVYRSWKSRHYPGRGILIATGHMKSSFQSTSTMNSATISNSASYFKYNQLGTHRMPARPMLAINHDVEDVVGHIIKQDVQEKIAAM